MKTISFNLEDDLDSALAELCTAQGREKSQLLGDLLRRYVESEKLKRTLLNPELVQLYQELAPEDVELAEEGISEYRQILDQADRA